MEVFEGCVQKCIRAHRFAWEAGEVCGQSVHANQAWPHTLYLFSTFLLRRFLHIIDVISFVISFVLTM